MPYLSYIHVRKSAFPELVFLLPVKQLLKQTPSGKMNCKQIEIQRNTPLRMLNKTFTNFAGE